MSTFQIKGDVESTVYPFDGAGQEIKIEDNGKVLSIVKNEETWKSAEKPDCTQKGPHRNGGFKDAFRNNMVLVYATKGSQEENEWWYHRALFDAEKFYYRGNGNMEVVKDSEFSIEKYPDQNIIIYGNRTNNVAWKSLLNSCSLQVENGKLTLGEKSFNGDEFGAYFIYPRQDSKVASIGIVTATGTKGMKASYANHYLVNGTTFPDVTIFDSSVVNNGISGVLCTGFFGNNWSVEKGDFQWR